MLNSNLHILIEEENESLCLEPVYMQDEDPLVVLLCNNYKRYGPQEAIKVVNGGVGEDIQTTLVSGFWLVVRLNLGI